MPLRFSGGIWFYKSHWILLDSIYYLSLGRINWVLLVTIKLGHNLYFWRWKWWEMGRLDHLFYRSEAEAPSRWVTCGWQSRSFSSGLSPMPHKRNKLQRLLHLMTVKTCMWKKSQRDIKKILQMENWLAKIHQSEVNNCNRQKVPWQEQSEICREFWAKGSFRLLTEKEIQVIKLTCTW